MKSNRLLPLCKRLSKWSAGGYATNILNLLTKLCLSNGIVCKYLPITSFVTFLCSSVLALTPRPENTSNARPSSMSSVTKARILLKRFSAATSSSQGFAVRFV